MAAQLPDDISIEEAGRRYEQAAAEFAGVKKKYAGRELGQMAEEDMKILFDCGMGLNQVIVVKSVQEQQREYPASGDTVGYKSTKLIMDIAFYEAKFENTGVTIVQNDPRRN